ncbi:MAG TPA: alpha-(1-_3)-arabinofuranosyltransferase family protein [Streptosporangiaceae bacterium]|nr:alpha-(1->3)-arabinofuranosyltransferase family protein [Streptosporangiaceae bacterium]
MIDAPGQVLAAARRRTQAVGSQRWWLVACCVALVGLAFGSHPGAILADTKIDLAINPAGFLQRALQLWDPAQFGQLQNQAVGYFFPVGPFFLLARLAAMPAWITQRLWITAILLAAFAGVVRLCRALGIGSPGSQLVAGLAYALSPIALSLLGYDSAQVLPSAMLPWILVPLVRAVQAGSAATGRTRARLAAQSAVAVALCSGINAAATVAVLVPAVIYLLAAPRPAPRWRVMAWWVPAVLLATAWWLIPLVLFARYGVSFLPYTESGSTTTSATGLFNTLRGTEDWLANLVTDGQPWLPAGYRISTGSLPAIVTGLVAGLGLTGLVSRRTPHRRFLVWLLVIGVFVVATGSVSALGNPLARDIDTIINGPLAPLRNFDKFDALIRLPIALGLASLLGQVAQVRPRAALTAIAVGAIGLVALPAYVSGLSVQGSFRSVPGYWTSAADWLNRHAGDSAVLEEPGARFGQYTWGSPLDDILQPLFVGDWAASQLGVIGSVGNTRLLEAIDQQMSAGQGSAGLTQLLGRMGIKYVLVRNDLLRADLRQAWPSRIHDAISESPGLVQVARFGRPGRRPADNAVRDVDPPYPPVEIYQVQGAQPAVVVQPTAGTLRVYGAPEALLTLADQGILAGRPVLLNTDGPQVRAAATVVTDSLRRRVRNFGEIRDDYSATLRPGQSLMTFEATADFIEPAWVRYEAVATYTGIANVWASSSDADIGALPNQSGTGYLPFAAVDGNLKTMWKSGSKSGPVGQWIRIKFDTTIDVSRIRVAFADSPAIGPPVRSVQIRTSAGRLVEPVRATSRYQVLRVPRGPTTWLRLRVVAVGSSSAVVRGSQVGIAEISIPGVHASRTIEAPAVRLPGGGDPTAIVLAKAEPQPTGCMLTSVRWVCSPSLETATEEQYGFDESFTLPRPSSASLSGSAVLTSTSLIQRYAFGGQQVVVSASSTYTADPQDQAYAAFDANQRTTWISGATDTRPRLTIAWPGARRLSSITVVRPAGATDLLAVQITGSTGQVRSVILGGPGREERETIRFAPMTTSSLTLTFSADDGNGPVQITDVQIPGVHQLVAHPTAPLRLGCGSGPALQVNGTPVPTRVSGTIADILDSRPMAFTACSTVPMEAGRNLVTEPASDAFSVQAVTMIRLRTGGSLSQAAPGPGSGATAVKILSWTSARRVVQVAVGQPSYLIVNENFNAGWQAVLNGRDLQPVRLDGWKQGWLLPAGSHGIVTLTYPPNSQYRLALFGGLAALFLIIVVAAVPLRRRAAVPEPRPVGPSSPGRSAGVLACGLCLAVPLGLWIGGYPGAGLLPVLTLGFLAAIGYRARSGLARAAADPWLVAALLVVAACGDAAGNELYAHGIGGVLLTALAGVLPELCCLAAMARLIAALLASQQSGDPGTDRRQDQPRYAPEG